MPGTLNRKQLIEAIAAQAGLSQADAEKALEAILEAIAQGLARGDRVAMAGLGTFSVATRAARAGRNPQTGEMLRIQGRNAVKFSAAKALKHAASEGPVPRSPALPKSLPAIRRSKKYGIVKGGAMRPPPAVLDEPRYLQTQLEQESDGLFISITPSDILDRMRSTRINVRIGYRDQAWASGSRPVEFEDETTLPRTLEVFFWEEQLSPRPQKQFIELPATGDSSVASFGFIPREDRGILEARITLVYQGRILQTGSLTAKVGDVDKASGWKFRLDGALEPNIDAADERPAFDMALVFNHSVSGQRRAFNFIEGDSAVIDIREDDVDKLTGKLNVILSRIAADPAVYSDPGSEESRKMFRDLAQRGATLRKEVVGVLPGNPDTTRRVQIVSTRGSYLPAEFMYDFEPPDDDARLCSGFSAALDYGTCCGACESDPDKSICPLGFWALSTVIERHARTRDPGDLAESAFRFLVRNAGQRESLQVLEGALLGASNRADSKDPTAVTDLHAMLLNHYPGQALPPVIRDWNDWSAAIKSARRSLLVLLPHHYNKEGFEILEIGEDSGLKADIVKTKHVTFDEASAPIVLLIGCITAYGRISFDSFVQRFHEAGASVVVGTVSTILGRHAGPATGILITEIIGAAKSGDGTMGVAMLNARRQLVRRGFPMSMGLSGYGGADWKLDAGGD